MNLDRKKAEGILTDLYYSTGAAYFSAKPLIGVASADDGLFQKCKRIIGDFHWTPDEALAQEFPDKKRCYEHLNGPMNKDRHEKYGRLDSELGCGMCQTGVPCEAGRPKEVFAQRRKGKKKKVVRSQNPEVKSLNSFILNSVKRISQKYFLKKLILYFMAFFSIATLNFGFSRYPVLATDSFLQKDPPWTL